MDTIDYKLFQALDADKRSEMIDDIIRTWADRWNVHPLIARDRLIVTAHGRLNALHGYASKQAALRPPKPKTDAKRPKAADRAKLDGVTLTDAEIATRALVIQQHETTARQTKGAVEPADWIAGIQAADAYIRRQRIQAAEAAAAPKVETSPQPEAEGVDVPEPADVPPTSSAKTKRAKAPKAEPKKPAAKPAPKKGGKK